MRNMKAIFNRNLQPSQRTERKTLVIKVTAVVQFSFHAQIDVVSAGATVLC